MDTGTYIMNMLCVNCDGHSIKQFKLGEPCKFKASKKDEVDPNLFLCPHCGCVTARATTRAGGI